MGYQVELLNFEGPLDLLLQLIERSKLDVTEIALATVTEQYLLYVDSLADLHPSELNSFIDVAAKLLHIKSQALLPSFTGMDTEPEPDDLNQQLEQYRRYQTAAKLLAQRLDEGVRSWDRPVTAGSRPGLPDINLDQLGHAFRAILERLPSEPAVISGPKISLDEMMAKVRQACRERLSISLGTLTDQAQSRAELVVLFLALLELVRLKEIRVVQAGAFGDIILGNEGER
jgi:segregation and condensation protein A